MRASVRANAKPFMLTYEGLVPEMYVDVKGLVTAAIGNLGDPYSLLLNWGWRLRSPDRPATRDEIYAEWVAVKEGKLAWYPGRPPRPLYLPADALDRLFYAKLDANEKILAARWPSWDRWPADAQLGAHSCAWAAGAAWRAPHFDIAAAMCTPGGFHVCAGDPGTNGDAPGARGEAWLNDEGNPGLRKRNLANQWLFQNAAVCLADGFDPEQLFWPTQLNG